jgi:hypothetical protein
MPILPTKRWTQKICKVLPKRHAKNASKYYENRKRAKQNRRPRFFVLSCQPHVRIFSFDMRLTYSKCNIASVSRYTISQAVPHLVRLFLSPDELSNRAPITVLLAELIAAARDSMARSSTDLDFNVPLMPFKDEVLGVFTVGLKATSSCQPALAGFKAMVTTPALLTDEELGFIVHNASDILQADPDNVDDAR